MIISMRFLSLPTALLLLIANAPVAKAGQDDQAPAEKQDHLPRSLDAPVEVHRNRRRDAEAVEHLFSDGHARPTGVKKMGGDRTEKFWPEFWGFEEEDMQQAILGVEDGWTLRKDFREQEAKLEDNETLILPFRPPFSLHTRAMDSADLMGRIDQRDIMSALRARDGFQCPGNTSPCNNIQESDYCCNNGETCYSITDTGLGPVGCCPNGQTCAGSIVCANGDSPCYVSQGQQLGYTGGGCCIPGYVCGGIGCVLSVASTSSSPSPSTQLLTSTLISQGGTSTTIIVVTVIQTPAIVSLTSTTTQVQSQSTSSTSTTTPSSGVPVGPVRKTTVTTSSPITSDTTSPNSICPTGFYACSATYRGGCCQTGQDCQTHSCPDQQSTTIVSSGQTIVVPLTASATSLASGHCPTGWAGCPTAAGGACCPSGWSCDTASCYSTSGTQSATTPKAAEVLNHGTRIGDAALGWMVVAAGVVFGLMVIV